MRYCVANHYLCSCVYDCICMDHEPEINYSTIIIINTGMQLWYPHTKEKMTNFYLRNKGLCKILNKHKN